MEPFSDRVEVTRLLGLNDQEAQMLPRELEDLARYLKVSSDGSVPIPGFTIDSRKAVAGDLFVAIIANRDGHDYIKSAAKNGAAAALVSKPTDLISICVENTERALGDLAHSIRATYQGDVFALTVVKVKQVPEVFWLRF